MERAKRKGARHAAGERSEGGLFDFPEPDTGSTTRGKKAVSFTTGYSRPHARTVIVCELLPATSRLRRAIAERSIMVGKLQR